MNALAPILWIFILGFAQLSAWWNHAIYPKVLVGLIVALAFLSGHIDIYGVMFLICFSALSLWLTRLPKNFRSFVLLGEIVLIFAAFLAYTHKIPGFYNIRVLSGVRFSYHSAPYSMYINFDKALCGTLIAILLCKSITTKFQMRPGKAILRGAGVGVVGGLALLALGSVLGQVVTEPKIPNYFSLWALNNLLIVCPAEEILFRGFLWTRLESRTSQSATLIISSLLFGLMHFNSGLWMILFASLAGGVFGFHYMKTKSLISTIFCHFTVNLVHILLFSYPFLQR